MLYYAYLRIRLSASTCRYGLPKWGYPIITTHGRRIDDRTWCYEFQAVLTTSKGNVLIDDCILNPSPYGDIGMS